MKTNKTQKTYWAVLKMITTTMVAVNGEPQELGFAGLAEGCKGIFIVFETHESALEFADNPNQIIEILETPLK